MTSTTGRAPQKIKQPLLHIPPMRGLRRFRLYPLGAVRCWRFALSGLGDARAAIAVISGVIINHAAANAVQPPATSSLAAVAIRVWRRCVWLISPFTFRKWHSTPLRRAVQVCSSMYTLFFCVEYVFCLVVCVCVCARGVTGTIGGDSGAEPALNRAQYCTAYPTISAPSAPLSPSDRRLCLCVKCPSSRLLPFDGAAPCCP